MKGNESGPQHEDVSLEGNDLPHDLGESLDPEVANDVPEWETYFPFEAPYPAQRQAIEETREPLEAGGFVTAELACGTGKTLFALLRGIELVRDPRTQYQRLLCLTSVKQQLRAFEDDLEAINANLDSEITPVSALTLVGKADMCSYVETDDIDRNRIYSRCDSLRDPVREVISDTENGKIQGRLTDLVNQSRVDPMSTEQPVKTAEWMAPYSKGFPTLGDDGDGPTYCPFYANYRLKTRGTSRARAERPTASSPPVLTGVMRPGELRAEASADGLCPHAVMADAIESAEVIVANYYHAFDPHTVEALTSSIIDDQTLVVCDEAHMLVPRVRDLLSDRLSRQSIQDAIDEIHHDILEQSNGAIEATMWEVLQRADITKDILEAFTAFLSDFLTTFDQMALTALDEEDTDWEQREYAELPDTVETPLRDPETPQLDRLSRWVAENNKWDLFENAGSYGSAIAAAIQTARDTHEAYEPSPSSVDTVGRVFQRWIECDHVRYLREIELCKRSQRVTDHDLAWANRYSSHLVLHNCLPADDIAKRFDCFGGGILMSATLSPLDIYQQTVGLDQLAANGRPVTKITADLPFPEANRASYAVELPKYTYAQRGSTTARDRTDEQEALRDRYAAAIRDVVRSTEGNVLIAMPSYAEAEWAAEVIRTDPTTEKAVLIDESSTDEATEALKATFFAGEGKVLTTSLRGTLTEGVDYDGDRLAACVCCGVPIQSLSGPLPTAIRTAYEHVFGSTKGFAYAFTVPAVRKSRQALGRVIRGAEEVGVRVVVDRRWTSTSQWDTVCEYLSSFERREYTAIGAGTLAERLQQFWSTHRE